LLAAILHNVPAALRSGWNNTTNDNMKTELDNSTNYDLKNVSQPDAKLPVMCRLTPAQKREYELLKKHGSVYVYGWQRRGVFERLKEKGLCYSQDWNWFHLNGT